MKFERIYAIPDIHGRRDLLDIAVGKLQADGYDAKKHLLVFLGDYIDRGPDSKGVLDILIKLQADNPGTVMCLRGNHESFAVNYKVNTHGQDIWYMNGGLPHSLFITRCRASTSAMLPFPETNTEPEVMALRPWGLRVRLIRDGSASGFTSDQNASARTA